MKTFLVIANMLLFGGVYSQNVGINADGATPHPSAILDVDASALSGTKKGFLFPRMTTVQRDAIISPAVGLMIYNLDTQCINVFDGTSWRIYCPNPSASSCPIGMVDFGTFSVEQVTHPSSNFFPAVIFCNQLGLRLCSIEEWYVACQSGLIPSMGNNEEWTGDFVDQNDVASMGGNGSNDCEYNTNRDFENPTVFRCCCEH